MQTDFIKVRDRIASCSSVVMLQAVWQQSQLELKYMPEHQRSALIAMKDFYHRMMISGTIHGYLAARKTVDDVFKNKQKKNTLLEPIHELNA